MGTYNLKEITTIIETALKIHEEFPYSEKDIMALIQEISSTKKESNVLKDITSVILSNFIPESKKKLNYLFRKRKELKLYSQKDLEKILKSCSQLYFESLNPKPSVPKLENFHYIPDRDLYIRKKQTVIGSSWIEAHFKLQSRGERMLTLPEFISFLNFLKENDKPAYEEMISTYGKTPEDNYLEWLDGEIHFKFSNYYLASNHLIKKGILIPKKVKRLDKHTLFSQNSFDFQISLDDFLNLDNLTSQGLPSDKISFLKNTKCNEYIFYELPKDKKHHRSPLGPISFYRWDYHRKLSFGHSKYCPCEEPKSGVHSALINSKEISSCK